MPPVQLRRASSETLSYSNNAAPLPSYGHYPQQHHNTSPIKQFPGRGRPCGSWQSNSPTFYMLCGAGSILIAYAGLYMSGLAFQGGGIGLKGIQEELHNALSLQQHMMEDMEEYRKSLSSSNQNTQNLKIENERLKNDVKTLEALTKKKNEMFVRRSDLAYEMLDEVEHLHGQIQKICKTEVMEKFGPGPHRIEFGLEFPKNTPTELLPKSGSTKFVLELAPLDLMPHSVHLFLEMADHKLWDGCSFVFSAEHVVMASARPYDVPKNEELSDNKKRKAFEDASHDKVSFQEYSAEYPHVQYTVGFAGRPGGPTFYVNMKDNTELHGPNGYDEHPDPCFGKIVEGLDVIEAMHLMPVDNDKWMTENVGIKYAKILGTSGSEGHAHHHEEIHA